MKETIKTLKNAWSENPQEMLETVVVFTVLFAAFYAAIWVGNALGLQ